MSDTPWSHVKNHGAAGAGIPNGTARKGFPSPNDELKKLYICVIPVGEIENFCPEIGLHDPKFVGKLLGERSQGDEKLFALRDFVAQVQGQA